MAVRNAFSNAVTRGVLRTTWTGLLNGDSGSPMTAAALSDKSVHVFGTVGTGGTLVVEGSNNGGLSWITLTDPQGSPLSFTAESLVSILENSLAVRPRVSSGDGTTNFSVVIVARSGAI